MSEIKITGISIENLFKKVVIPYIRKGAAIDGINSPCLLSWMWRIELQVDDNNQAYLHLDLKYTPRSEEGIPDKIFEEIK